MDRDPATHVALSRIHFPVTTLGPGVRVGIWFQGCSIGCEGCVSPDTWASPSDHQWLTINSIVEWVASRDTREINGVTISGGEPFDQAQGLHGLLQELRRMRALDDVDVLVYSGYTLSQLVRRHEPTLALLDAVLTGPYVESRPTTLPWRGSSNQRLTLLTDLARERYALPYEAPSLQVSADGGQLWITGIPRRQDLDRFEKLLGAQGIALGDASWRT